MKKSLPTALERKALKVDQPSGRDLYLLTLTGDELLAVSGISRVSRDHDGKLIGYQRAEVRKHVKAIAEYLESPDMLLAHPIILAFDSTVRLMCALSALSLSAAMPPLSTPSGNSFPENLSFASCRSRFTRLV